DLKLFLSRSVVQIGGREQPPECWIGRIFQLIQDVRRDATKCFGNVGRETHVIPTLPTRHERLLEHQSSFCIVAHNPCSCSAATYASQRSFGPFHTTDFPSTCTCIISFCAFARPYPNSFCNTYVTYAIKLIGSFQTIMIQGRSGSATLSVSGVSSLTGAVIVSARIVLDRQHSVLSPGPLDRLPFRVN